MHVGWAAVFDPPADGSRPSFAQLRNHLQSRLQRAPRYRQRLLGVPLGLHAPVWVDDARFDISRHVLRADTRDLDEVIGAAMSVPLERDRPLWECWVAPRLHDGRLAMVGKVHHCLADGLAAVELASLLLDADPVPPPVEADGWTPSPSPGFAERTLDALIDRARENLGLLRAPRSLLASPLRFAEDAARLAETLAHAVYPLAPESATFNEPISPLRHLARLHRPIDDLVAIKQRYSVSLNDAMLAACAGGVRSFLRERGERPIRLKAMVPVSVRAEDEHLGNRISFMFIGLPCDEPDPARRIAEIGCVTSERKAYGEPALTDAALAAVALAPGVLQRMVTRVVSSPRTFNLVVSNIPGPRAPLWMLGCELREAYPVVPLADHHALSIGVTTIRDSACFGLYADRKALPDAQALANHIDAAIDELLHTGPPPSAPRNGRLRVLPPALVPG